MQFKVIASVLLFFVAQAMAEEQVRCTFNLLIFASRAKTNHTFRA